MGGFAAQVQNPPQQESVQPQPTGGKGVGQAVQQVTDQTPAQQQTPASAPQNPNPDQGEPSPFMGKGGGSSFGNYTNSATSGQPQMGAPNKYPNTIGNSDNSRNQSPQFNSGGKGKG